MSDRPDRKGKGFMAVGASLVHPGLGHVVAGRWRRGAIWAALVVMLEVTAIVMFLDPDDVPLLLAVGPMIIVLTLAAHVDAFICGRRSRGSMLGAPWKRYAAGAMLMVVALLLNPLSFFGYSAGTYVRNHYVESFVQRMGAMSPTLQDGDFFMVHKKEPWSRWSVVVIQHPQYGATNVSVRIVGLPGEKIEIIDDTLHVNGKPMELPEDVGPYRTMTYLGRYDTESIGTPGAGCSGNPITLAEDEYFVLGDNSMVALDARLWEIPVDSHQLGALPSANIKGRVTVIYWPPDRWRCLE